jgi:hypothetical protein
LERILLLLERWFFLKNGQSIFWDAFVAGFFSEYFSLGKNHQKKGKKYAVKVLYRINIRVCFFLHRMMNG